MRSPTRSPSPHTAIGNPCARICGLRSRRLCHSSLVQCALQLSRTLTRIFSFEPMLVCYGLLRAPSAFLHGYAEDVPAQRMFYLQMAPLTIHWLPLPKAPYLGACSAVLRLRHDFMRRLCRLPPCTTQRLRPQWRHQALRPENPSRQPMCAWTISERPCTVPCVHTFASLRVMACMDTR